MDGFCYSSIQIYRKFSVADLEADAMGSSSKEKLKEMAKKLFIGVSQPFFYVRISDALLVSFFRHLSLKLS